MFTKPLLAILALAVGASAGCKDCSLNKNGIWKGNCGAYFEESSKFGDWTPTLSRRRLEAGDEAGEKAHFKKFLTAMQRQGRIEVGDQTEAADQATRRLSECTNTCLFNNDEECDDGQTGSTTSLCACGTDCSDCGERASCEATDDDYITGITFSIDSDFGCMKDVCCAEDKDDCCELNVGAVVGTLIALVVVIVGSIFACCKFCPSCPMNNIGKETEMQPVATVTRVETEMTKV
jgi:hypothetical protein